ncbi:hypothetical protein PVL29_004711 [Vitis rotundifolia]|uniref:TOG domain-containing protein n=1 Tax=Vitis rotundifolia TaxID=103349 RepID=A0AA39A8Q3_VITRO|nr:hypothetical protein PVL29_004711 [Vitis rotundifolia]
MDAEEPGIREKALELLGSDPQALQTSILNLTSPDPSLHSNAQTLLAYLGRHYTNSLCFRVSCLILSTSDASIRESIVNFLRLLRTASGAHFWTILSIIHQNDIKRVFLECLEKETSTRVAKILCKLVLDVAVESEWPELVPFMLRCFEASDIRVQETSLFLFGLLSETLGEKLSCEPDKLQSLFLKCLGCENWRVRAAAVGASVRLIVFLMGTSSNDLLEQLSAPIMDTFDDAMANGIERYARKVVKHLTVLMRKKPGFLRSRIDTCIAYMLIMAENKVWSEKSRHLAVKFLITLAEKRHQGIAMLKILPDKITRILSLLFKMVADIKDVNSWYEAESHHKNSGETNNCSYGKESLRRFAIAKHVDITDEKFITMLAEYINDREWQKRHAVPAALAQMIVGCSEEMLADLTSVIKIASRSSQDSHPRVRWAAIDLLEQLSKYFCPQLQNQHHQLVIPILTKALLDFQNPRIQAHAASAISCFSQSCTSSILKPHLDVIVRTLLKLLQKGSQSLKEEALTALASLASSSQEHFQEYYVAVIPYLKVMSMQGKSNHRLLAKAMECITMIWMAVGKDICRKDCQEVVELLISLQESQMETDDPMRICILEVWGRLCKCLGKEFLPYMNVAMPHLLQSAAQLKIDFTNKLLNASLNLLEEKARACNMLCSCAAELKEDFHLWIDEVANTLIPLLKFNLHQEVRMAAASAMPLILDSAKLAVEKGYILEVDESPVMKLSAQITPAMTAALYMEPKAENCARFLGSLNGCIQISGPYLTDNEAKFLMDEITKFLIARSLRRHAREQGLAQDSEAGERELLKEESENEKKVYNNVGDCMATLIKRFKLSVVPFFEKLLICVARTWVDRTTIEKKLAIRIFHEIAEQCGEEALKHYQSYLPFLLEACKSDKPEVQQVAAWVIGICAEFGGSFFKTIVDVALSSLNSVISHPNALQPDHVMVHDVAVSALGKICYFHYDNIKEAEVLSTWLSHLPITNLLNEAKVAHQYLCRVVERTKTEPLSVYLPSIIRVFAEILWAGSNLATAQTVSQMIGLLKNSKQTLPTEWASICSSLVPQRQNFLKAILPDT